MVEIDTGLKPDQEVTPFGQRVKLITAQMNSTIQELQGDPNFQERIQMLTIEAGRSKPVHGTLAESFEIQVLDGLKGEHLMWRGFFWSDPDAIVEYTSPYKVDTDFNAEEFEIEMRELAQSKSYIFERRPSV